MMGYWGQHGENRGYMSSAFVPRKDWTLIIKLPLTNTGLSIKNVSDPVPQYIVSISHYHTWPIITPLVE